MYYAVYSHVKKLLVSQTIADLCESHLALQALCLPLSSADLMSELALAVQIHHIEDKPFTVD